MKNFKKNLKEFVQTGLGCLGVAVVFLSLLVGLVKFIQWKEYRASYHQIAHNETIKYIAVDGGYYTKLESTTYAYGNGDTITKRSLRFIPAKTNTFFADSTGLEDITFWDYENDGKWNEVFLCGYPTHKYGANSVIFNGGIHDWQKWEWSPCRGDENMKPIDACAINHTIGLIVCIK
ncbi:MAG: hypothetical protein WCL02_02365 [bacterium]